MKFSFRAVGHWSKGILTLRELREEDEGKGVEPHYGFENYANKETDTKYQRGSGEAHLKSMPSQPRYVLLNEDEEIDYKDIETRLANYSALEEEKLVSEFEDRLNYNLGKAGPEIEREVSRHKTAAKKPEGGWTYVIKPLDRHGDMEPFAAKADGTIRELTESERVFLDRQKGRPRPRIPRS